LPHTLVSPRGPVDLTLEIAPRARVDVVDVRQRMLPTHCEALAPYPRCVYWSSHTTAGFLDHSLVSRLSPPHGVQAYVDTFRTFFPEGAGYEHDQLDRRTDLCSEQRKIEPRNADSHLAFMASGLRTCVTYPNTPGQPVLFIDLDGVNEGRPRRRTTRIIGFHREEDVASLRIEVPVSGHPIDAINLKDPRLGVYEQVSELIARTGLEKGRVRLALHGTERSAGLTINEHETLLMRHDLTDVLRDPLRFAYEKGKHVLADPRAVPQKALGYAQYDLLRVLNRVVEGLGLSESRIERLLARTMAFPLSRFFRMHRSVSLLVSSDQAGGRPAIIEGLYQSPILIQWQRPGRQARALDVTLTRLR
jgi:thiamine phosphate synthase YjbQ (UPF0047 family)